MPKVDEQIDFFYCLLSRARQLAEGKIAAKFAVICSKSELCIFDNSGGKVDFST